MNRSLVVEELYTTRDERNAWKARAEAAEAELASVRAENESLKVRNERLRDENVKLHAASVIATMQSEDAWARVAQLEVALGEIVDEENTVSHSHDVPGVWDLSNGPPRGGTACERCAKFTAARALLASQPLPSEPEEQ